MSQWVTELDDRGKMVLVTVRCVLDDNPSSSGVVTMTSAVPMLQPFCDVLQTWCTQQGLPMANYLFLFDGMTGTVLKSIKTRPVAALFCAFRGITAVTCGGINEDGELVQDNDEERRWCDSVASGQINDPRCVVSSLNYNHEHWGHVTNAQEMLHNSPRAIRAPLMVPRYVELYFAGLFRNPMWTNNGSDRRGAEKCISSHDNYLHWPMAHGRPKYTATTRFPVVQGVNTVQIINLTVSVDDGKKNSSSSSSSKRGENAITAPGIYIPDEMDTKESKEMVRAAIDVAFDEVIGDTKQIRIGFSSISKLPEWIVGASWTAALGVALCGVTLSDDAVITGEIRNEGYFETSNTAVDVLNTDVIYAVGDTDIKVNYMVERSLRGAARGSTHPITIYISDSYPEELGKDMYERAMSLTQGKARWISGLDYAFGAPQRTLFPEVILAHSFLELIGLIAIRRQYKDVYAA